MQVRRAVVLLFLCLGFFSTLAIAERAEAKQKIVIAVESKSRDDFEKSFAGLMAHLAKSPDYEIQFDNYPSYDDVYSALKSAKADFAFVGAVLYAQAHSEIGAVAILAEGGFIRSMIVTKKDSPFKTMKDLKGKTFAFGYENSTSTHLLPLLLISKNLMKESDFGKTVFVGPDQHKIVAQVLSGAVDAAGIVEPVYNQYVDKLKVIDKSDPFPGSTLMGRKDSDPKLIEKLQALFLGYKGVPGQRFPTGAIKVTNNDYNQVRFLCKVVLGKTYL
jgi:phosphonate transport system substrate-binding protein